MKRSIPFLISGLPIEPFVPYFELTDAELAARGARRCIADAPRGYPCRVSLEEAKVGEPVILLVYPHHQVSGPYQGTGPIYVRVGARPARLEVNAVPEIVRTRLMSLRAYDAEGSMVASTVADGSGIEAQIQELFADEKVAYLHLHNAKPGCYSCRVDRAQNA